jgi:hypothetical protein
MRLWEVKDLPISGAGTRALENELDGHDLLRFPLVDHNIIV